MTEPEPIGKLAKEVLKILERRCKESMKAKPRTFNCTVCEDQALVWVRRRHGGLEKGYTYFETLRCHCDQSKMGWIVTEENRKKGLNKRTPALRKWDREIQTYKEAEIPEDHVYSLSARLAYEEQEHQHRKAAETPEAVAERKAIQGEP